MKYVGLKSMYIPSLDLADFIHGDENQRDSFVSSLGTAYSQIGFAAIRNHLLEEDVEKKLYALTRAFFDLPEEVKKQYEIEGMAGQRGYTSFGTEHAKDSPMADLKEFFHFGQEIRDESVSNFDYPENLDVKELPEFRTVAMQAYRQLEETGKYMLRAMALFLGLDEFYFDAKIFNGNSILRPIHYGPIQEHPQSAVRAGAHEDINLITLLMGASSEGLEILDKEGKWHSVTALPDHLVVNVGDMLQRLTNHTFCSTTHRVVNPPQEKWHIPRYSIPFFLHPRSEVRLDCLPECVNEQNPARYSPIRAGEYLMERLREIGLSKK